MAKTTDTLAQKKRKQMIILAVGGVILLALVALQGPKLLGGDDSSTPTSEATTSANGSSTTPGSTAAPAATIAPGAPRTVLVGVTVGGTGSTPAAEGQLRLFTLFKAKDPFVQSVPSETSGATSPTSGPTLSDTQPGSGSGGSAADASAGAGGGTSNTAPTPGVLQYATISVNGEPEALTLKQKFPEGDGVFVLVSLKPKAAKIAVAGGSFTDAETIQVPLGKNVTLVNTATGARYALKLVYVGDEAEQVQGFTTGAAKQK